MKKSLFISTIIFGTALLIGCSKVVVDMPSTPSSSPTASSKKSDISKDTPISFTAAVHANQTKDSNDNNAELDETIHFKSYAYYTGNYYWESIDKIEVVNYINGVEVSKNDGIWSLAKEYCWPKAGNLTFLGYAPYSADLNASADTTVLWKKNYTNDGTDLMVADVVTNLNLHNSKTGVPMTFHHVLSQIKFNIRAKKLAENDFSFIINVTNVTLNDVYRTADFSWTEHNKAYWKNPHNPAGLVIYNGTGISLSEANTTLDSGRIVLPQTLDHVTLAVTFSLTTKKGSETLDTTTVTETIPLNSARIPQWTAGGGYLYNIIVNPLSGTSITFDPVVSEWSTASNTIPMK